MEKIAYWSNTQSSFVYLATGLPLIYQQILPVAGTPLLYTQTEKEVFPSILNASEAESHSIEIKSFDEKGKYALLGFSVSAKTQVPKRKTAIKKHMHFFILKYILYTFLDLQCCIACNTPSFPAS
jgi:hypothetical protein